MDFKKIEYLIDVLKLVNDGDGNVREKIINALMSELKVK